MSEQDKRADGNGTIERRGIRVYAKVPRSDGSRPRIPLGKNLTDEAARAKLDAFLDRGRETGKLDAMIERLLEKNARTRRGKVVAEKKLTTVREIGEAWLGGELFEKHGAVNGLRPSSMEHNTNGYNSNAVLNKRAYSLRTRGPQGPLFGDLLAADVAHEDIARIMALQTGAAAGTRNHLHSYLSRIFSIAEIPLGLRTPGTSPVLSAYRARKDPAKLYNFLYPPEILALVRNVDVPLGRLVARGAHGPGRQGAPRRGPCRELRTRGAEIQRGVSRHHLAFSIFEGNRPTFVRRPAFRASVRPDKQTSQ